MALSSTGGNRSQSSNRQMSSLGGGSLISMMGGGMMSGFGGGSLLAQMGDMSGEMMGGQGVDDVILIIYNGWRPASRRLNVFLHIRSMFDKPRRVA